MLASNLSCMGVFANGNNAQAVKMSREPHNAKAMPTYALVLHRPCEQFLYLTDCRNSGAMSLL
jgi:hypothetical protein